MRQGFQFLPDCGFNVFVNTKKGMALPCPYPKIIALNSRPIYSRFHVYEVHPDCSSIAVGTRHCRVPTSVVYLTNLKSAVTIARLVVVQEPECRILTAGNINSDATGHNIKQ